MVLKVPVPFKIKVGKVGHSLRITIPKEIAEYLNIKEGDVVLVFVSNSEIVVKRQKKGEQ